MLPGNRSRHEARERTGWSTATSRIYDYLLGGKDNYAADRAEAARLLGVFPLLPLRARQNRLFLARAVTWLASRGIRQYVDIGCGLPTADNTHEVAQTAAPGCRVVR
jgi:S-adenosyl methyltransferase